MLALVAMATACECASSHVLDGGDDAGRDGGADAGRDGGRRRDAGRDATVDGGPLVAFPDGWERVPWMPLWCDAWRPRGTADGAVAPLRFEACEPADTGCEALVVDWERSPWHHNFFIARGGWQTTGGPVIAVSRVVLEEGVERIDDTLFDVGGQPVVVFREHVSRSGVGDPGFVYCRMTAIATARENDLALAFDVTNGRYSHTHDDDDFSVYLLTGRREELQRTENIVFDLDVRDLLSEGNVPRELHYDGSTLVLQGLVGAVYLGSLAGGPWGAIATGRTDDIQNDSGILFDGAFYWTGVPADGRSWERIRRREVSGTANETFMARTDGALGDFRTDGTWAAWTHAPDDDPVDGVPDRTNLYGARIDGDFDPAHWTPSLLATLPYPLPTSRPIFWNGIYAYIAADHLFEMVDVVRRRRWRAQLPPDTWWETLLHMDNEYLFLVHADVQGINGMRRYRIADLGGWEDL